MEQRVSRSEDHNWAGYLMSVYSPHYFKSCKISAVALIKMVSRCGLNLSAQKIKWPALSIDMV